MKHYSKLREVLHAHLAGEILNLGSESPSFTLGGDTFYPGVSDTYFSLEPSNWDISIFIPNIIIKTKFSPKIKIIYHIDHPVTQWEKDESMKWLLEELLTNSTVHNRPEMMIGLYHREMVILNDMFLEGNADVHEVLAYLKSIGQPWANMIYDVIGGPLARREEP